MFEVASQQPSALIVAALDPARSVVVEACAGSGKTWLLASRIVRLLLAGVPPGEILAITFTRKAAREIEERVVGWLQLLATDEPDALRFFLAERGVTPDAEMLRTARGLYERVLVAQPGLAVNTFHGWFLQLVDAAPLSEKLAGAKLVESDSRFFEELWQAFAADLQKAPESLTTQAFVRLFDAAGMDSARRLMSRALARRSEWRAFGLGCGATGEAIAGEIVAALAAQFGIDASRPGQALVEFFAGDWSMDVVAYLDFLEASTLASDLAHAGELRLALAEADAERRFSRLRAVFLTKEETLRRRNPGVTLDARFGVAGAARFLDLHGGIGERVLACLARLLAERIVAFNSDACAVFEAFLAYADAFRKARRQFDFVDAEWMVHKLLRDENTCAFLQARLDARYRHVLVDEFQDTNPLQWQILTSWLAAYTDSTRPCVFIVGDPKQSIYRFRRAEPKLFAVAADFLVREYAALRCEQDATRRNAQPIVDVVNAVFLDVPEFAPFRRQYTLAGDLPGRVELIPLCARTPAAEAPPRVVLRDPLVEADVEAEDLRLDDEARCLAAKILEIVGSAGGRGAWQVDEKDASGGKQRRAARYGDILLLVRTRTHLAIYERALAAADIPFDAASRGGLLAALEVRDIVALLEFLVSPVADLRLAQALRCPLFAGSDEDLLQLAGDGESSWWHRLQSLAARSQASPALARAERLLGNWLQAADRLPAHDLLDRIFHQGEVLARYRLAVPPAASASVEANLRALLLLALDVDGGRYPSLPRFIDELRELRDAEANDAPDEGEIETPDADSGRVRLLTIHSAKGLEAPIVWLLGANGAPRPQDPWDLLVDWPPDAPAPRHFSFFGRKNERGAARQTIFDAEAAAARREELNLLYVAMTRARQVFIASGVENGKAANRSRDAASGEPGASAYRLLESAVGRLAGGLAYGDVLPTGAVSRAPETSAQSLSGASLPAIGERRSPPDLAARFGILLHALLEHRTGATSSGNWWQALGFDDAEYARVLPVAERLLAAPALRRFFDPALHRRAWNEIEIAAGGSVQRIDRLIEFDDAVWVLDYKSSGSDSSRLADYEQQVHAYCVAVAKIFPDVPVRGALLFSDAVLVDVR